jgi:nuclear pore complex protein Nup155
LCLLIYHAADYRSIPDIRSTWTNLIDQAHRKAIIANSTAPWEVVALKILELGQRTSLNENVFPINIVLQLLLQYDLEFYVHDANAPNAQNLAFNEDLMWPIAVFVKLQAPYESLVATLEALWYAQEQPFAGRNRKLLVKWIIYLFGGPENAIGLAEVMRIILGSDVLGRDVDDQSWIQRARDMSAVLEEAAR